MNRKSERLLVSSVWEILKKRVIPISLAALCASLLCFLLLSLIDSQREDVAEKPSYMSVIDFSVQIADTDGNYHSGSALSFSHSYMTTLKYLLTTDHAAEKISQYCDGAFSADSIKRITSVAVEKSTPVIRLTVYGQLSENVDKLVSGYVKAIPELIAMFAREGKVNVVDRSDSVTMPDPDAARKDRAAYAVIAFVLVFAGLLVTYTLAELFRKTVKDKADLADANGIPAIATISSDNRKERLLSYGLKGKSPSHLNNEIAYSHVDEYSRLWMAIANKVDDGKILAVLSADGGSEAAVVAANAAYAISQTGRKVILVDGNLRESSINDIFDIKNKKGIAEVLEGKENLSNAVVSEVSSNLDVLSSGECSRNPSAVLGGIAMKKLMAELSSAYENVIIAAPAVNTYADGLIESNYADGLVVTVRSNSTKYSDVEDTVEKAESVGCNLLGAVLID